MNKGIGKNAFELTISKMIIAFIAFITSMLLSRFRSLEEYGTYSQILIVSTLATSMFTLGLPNSINYFLALASDAENRNKFLSVYYLFNTALCILMGIVLLIAMPYIALYFGNELINNYSYMFLLFPWASVIIASMGNVLVVYNKTRELVVYNIVNAGIPLFALLITKAFGWQFNHYLILYVFGEMVLMVAGYSIIYRLEKPFHIYFDWDLINKILRFSIPVGLASLIGTLNIEVDKLMVGRLFSTESLAVYSNASKELPITMISTSLTAVLLPQMVRLFDNGKKKEAIQLWGTAIELSYTIISFFVMVLIVFAPQIITLMFSEKYLSGVSVFRIYSAVLLLRCTYFGIVLNTTGKTKLILYSSIATLILNVIMNYGLYLVLGITGPAVATFLSVAVVDFVQLIFTSKETKVSIKSIFPWKSVIILTLLNTIFGVCGMVLVKHFNIGTSAKDIMKACILGMGLGITYFLIVVKYVNKKWKSLNE